MKKKKKQRKRNKIAFVKNINSSLLKRGINVFVNVNVFRPVLVHDVSLNFLKRVKRRDVTSVAGTTNTSVIPESEIPFVFF